MNELTLIKHNGGAYIDSREVAEIIGKRHDNLLRDIGKYREILARGGLLKIEESDFFIESCYLNAQNKVMPCYLISKRGAEVIANKLTGEKGVLFTFAYVSRFNEMEAAERKAEIKAYARPRLNEFNSAVRNVLSGMSYAYTTPDKVMDFLHGVYEPLGIKVTNDADGMEGYYQSATEIARSVGLYSDTGRPHAHAVAAIIAKLDMPVAEHTIAVPYGLVGVSLRYDLHVDIAVCQWLIDNRCPDEIPHLGFEYHVHYHLPDDDDSGDYTAEELNAMCGEYGDCDDCPGFSSCCELD